MLGCELPSGSGSDAGSLGFKIAMGALDGARLSVGSCSVGAAQACFEIALNYVKVLIDDFQTGAATV
jgi:alkylation response protein AidB-like acyl-CoA dehydrogenase